MLYKEETAYLNIARDIIETGYKSGDRTKTGIRKLHARHMEFDVRDGRMPVLTTRKIPTKSLLVEMLWFISGSTDIKFLKDNNVSIWDSWVDTETATFDANPDYGLRSLVKKGLIKLPADFNSAAFFEKHGPGSVNQMLSDIFGVEVSSRGIRSGSIGDGAYGAQWTRWEDTRILNKNEIGFEKKNILTKNLGYSKITETDDIIVYHKKYNQLQKAIEDVRNNSESRRIVVSAWNPGKLDLAALPPCHTLFQFLPFEKDGELFLDLALTCRSQDFLVGTVFNVAQYAALLHMVCKVTGRKPHKLYWTGNNTHIYDNQVELFNTIHDLRQPYDNNDIRLVLSGDQQEISDFKIEDLKITGYNNFGESINYPVAV